jgi:CHAT domain-containing protein
MNFRGIRALLPALLGCALATGAVAAPAAAHGKRFDGFQPSFNLGQAANGAVCEATRSFDGPVVDHGGRAWVISCRGWSNALGALYLFPGGRSGAAETAWKADLASRTDCKLSAEANAADASRPVRCKTKAAGLDFVAISSDGRAGRVGAEGRAPIAEVVAKGARFLAGTIPEPEPVDLATSAVSQVSTAPVSQLGATDGARGPTTDSLRAEAYALGQDWQFDQAEFGFAELSRASGSEVSDAERAEALYNRAFNASNVGRFDKAAIFFAQADALAVHADTALRGLALNYKAADARNQENYEDAIKLADEAMAERAAAGRLNGVRTANGDIAITEVGTSDGTDRISKFDRERLRDVQALEIKGTSLESSGRRDDARAVLAQARALLFTTLPVRQNTRKPVRLGEAAPWLTPRVLADLLRLDRGTPRQAETEAQFRAAVAIFAVKHPGSLPLAGFFLEQARAEAELGKQNKDEDEKAVVDYQAAFDIFIDQRGSLADSADLARPYFDFLLRRIGDSPASHPKDVRNFFNAAQALIAQSSAEAAKRQAAAAQASDNRTAGLARALEDTDRREQATLAAIRKLNEQGVYQGAQIAGLEAERTQLGKQNATLQGQLLEIDPGYTSALHVLVDLDQLQKTLTPGEVYVKDFLLAGGGYGILISPDTAVPYRIDLTRDQANETVRKLRQPIDFPRRARNGRASHGVYNVALAHQLFEAVFGPVRQQVLAARHIVYEPDATLIAIPISALVTDTASADLVKSRLAGVKPVDYLGVAWLGAHSYNSIALSAAAFYQARQAKPSRATNAFFGYGDPVIPSDPDVFSSVRPAGAGNAADDALCATYRASLALMQPLPETLPELTSVAKALLGPAYSDSVLQVGEAFTDTAVLGKTDLANYRIVYFATHGLLDEGNPCLHTALLTSYGGPGSDALLGLSKITSLRLDADMVVLSACNTGSNAHGRALLQPADATGSGGGKAVALIRLGAGDGEALGGLVTSFVEAGARNVVVSSWEVDSATTQSLMTGLFDQKGVSQAEALAKAERVLMNQPSHSHPYYWAPFMVVGDGDRPMPVS